MEKLKTNLKVIKDFLRELTKTTIVCDRKDKDKAPTGHEPSSLYSSPPIASNEEMAKDRGNWNVRGINEEVVEGNHQDLQYHCLEILLFDGNEAFDWFLKVEQYFQINRLTKIEKLIVARVCIEGDALYWL